jgi:nucleotide-binding universal stress UspA family protein
MSSRRLPFKLWLTKNSRSTGLPVDASQPDALTNWNYPLQPFLQEADMIKDILVHISTERPMRPAIDASISLAAGFGAHLDAFALGYVSTGAAAYAFDGGAAAAVAAIFEREQERAVERATTALSVFETEARHAGISYECRPIADVPGEAAASIGAAARLYDLSVVLQPQPDLQTFDNTIPTEILLRAGGPVLFLPYISRGAFKAKRIGICWDGSRLAARALKDAKPFLAQADALVAISINAADNVPPDASPEKLSKHLARVGLPVRLINLPAARTEIQPCILSIAADENLDMLVMGAYGHSRLQEGILGGVTREMQRSMTVPTLMSH